MSVTPLRVAQTGIGLGKDWTGEGCIGTEGGHTSDFAHPSIPSTSGDLDVGRFISTIPNHSLEFQALKS